MSSMSFAFTFLFLLDSSGEISGQRPCEMKWPVTIERGLEQFDSATAVEFVD